VDDGSPWKRLARRDYRTMRRRTDAALGRLADALRHSPDGDEVLVVITADHGEEFGEHGDYYHGFSLHDSAVRVPIIVWSPREPRRFVAAAPPRALSELGDYLLSAVTQRPVLEAADTLLRTVFFDDQVGLVSDGWKVIFNRTRDRVELFDLATDPAE